MQKKVAFGALGAVFALTISASAQIKAEQPVILSWNTQTKEIAVLLAIIFLHTPLILVLPTFVSGLCSSMLFYYFVHRKSHLDPGWAQRYLPWHYEHHIFEGLSGNWCISWPLCDYIFGTRASPSKVSVCLKLYGNAPESFKGRDSPPSNARASRKLRLRANLV